MSWNKRITQSFIVLIGILITQVSLAVDSDSKNMESIKVKIESLFTDIKVETIGVSPIENLYQITAGPLVLYATKDGRYAVTGDLVDLDHDRLNLTEQARKGARIQALEKLGENNMIVFSPEKPKTTVTVFTDIDCGYCRKLHDQISKMKELGIKVRYLAFPRTGLDSRSFDKAVAVWCSKDPAAALTLAKQGKDVPNVPGCNKHDLIQKEFNFGMLTGVMGTPTFILEDGTLVPGYLPPERLLELTEKFKVQAR